MANLTSVTLTSGVPTAGTGTVGTLDNVTGTAGSPSVPVLTVQGVASGTPQPVSIASLPSGAVTNAGTFAVQNTAATPAGTNTIGSVKVTDGTNTGVVKAASTAPVAADPALVVSISPNSVNANGQATMANSAPVVISSNQTSFPVTVATGTATIGAVNDPYSTYKTVAASVSAQVLGSTGAIGDYLSYVTVFPGTAGCGVVTILDNATTIGTFAGGATTALPSLVPFRIDIGAVSASGAWKVTTGANVTCVGVGKFT